MKPTKRELESLDEAMSSLDYWMRHGEEAFSKQDFKNLHNLRNKLNRMI
jgi:hypothetical protein